jgi:hypothetical protein
MSITINVPAVTLFEAQVHKVYQEGYDLKGLVRQKNVKGAKEVKFPVMGKAVARQKAIHADVLPADVVHTQATATMQDWYASEYTDIFKNEQINFDEVTELADILKSACGRRIDNILISAAAAASGTGTVAANIGSTTDMNFEKIVAAMGSLDDAGVPQEGRTLLMNHRSYRQLLADSKFTSSDFGQFRYGSTSKGNKQPYLAFDIVTINDRVETDATRLGLPKSGDDVTAFAFHRDSIGMGFNMELSSEVNYIAHKLAYLSTVKFSAGATAIDSTGIVKITVTQA